MLEGKAKDITYVLIALLVVLFNSIEIILILRVKNKKIFDRLLLSLASSDVLVGAVVAIIKAVDIKYGSNFSWLQKEDFVNIFLLSMIFSVVNLIAITVDRFLAVQFPIKHRILSTAKRANVCIAVLWMLCLISVIFHGLVTFIWINHITLLLYVSSFSILVYSVLIIVLYGAIFQLIRKRKIQAAKGNVKEGNEARGRFSLFLNDPNRTERSVLFTGLIVAISFVICTYPFVLQFLISQSVQSIHVVSKILLLMNSLLNPFIYFFNSYCGAKSSRTTTEEIEVN